MAFVKTLKAALSLATASSPATNDRQSDPYSTSHFRRHRTSTMLMTESADVSKVRWMRLPTVVLRRIVKQAGGMSAALALMRCSREIHRDVAPMVYQQVRLHDCDQLEQFAHSVWAARSQKRAQYLMSLVNHMRLECTNIREHDRFATLLEALSSPAVHDGASGLPNLGTMHMEPLLKADRLLPGICTSPGILLQIWALSIVLPTYEDIRNHESILPRGETRLQFLTIVYRPLDFVEADTILHFIGQQNALQGLKLDLARHFSAYLGAYEIYVKTIVAFCYGCCGSDYLPVLHNIKIVFSDSRSTDFVESLMQRELNKLTFTNRGRHVCVEVVRA